MARPISVAVLGGGILGVSTALHLARKGAEVRLVTAAAVGDGASGRSLSWLNSARMRSDAYHRLRMAGLARYRTLAWSHPETRAWLRFDGGLTWDRPGVANGIAAAHAHEHAIGYESCLLSANEVTRRIPGVDAGTIGAEGAIFNPGEGWVDLPALIAHLLEEFRARGGTIIQNAGAARVETEGGRATGLHLENGPPIVADRVVLATGAAVPRMVATFGVTIPDATPVALLVKTRAFHHDLRAVLNTPRVALRPAPDGGIVCDSAWSEEAVNQDGHEAGVERIVAQLLAEAACVLAGRPALALETYRMGPKPVPGDGEPVIGPVPGLVNCHMVFSHSGATLGLILGECLADEVMTGQRHPMLAPFGAERF